MFPRYLRLSAFHVFLSLLNSFHERWFSLSCIGVFFVMYWCTSCVWLQLLPFIDNRHLESIPCFRRFTVLNINYIKILKSFSLALMSAFLCSSLALIFLWHIVVQYIQDSYMFVLSRPSHSTQQKPSPHRWMDKSNSLTQEQGGHSYCQWWWSSYR